MGSTISDSKFNMWRALFALVHADGVTTKEEVNFMAEVMEDVAFSDEQRDTLKSDASDPQDPVALFSKIEEPLDQAKFFKYARKLVHIDGDFGEEEQDIMLKLERLHIETVDMDALIGKTELYFEGDARYKEDSEILKVSPGESVFTRFRDLFLKKLKK